MKLVRNYGSPFEAHIAEGMLSAHGIRTRINANASSSIFPAPDGGISNVGLYVPEEDYQRATQLLNEHGD